MIYNFATAKDILFRIGLKKVPGLKEFSDASTEFLQKISIGTTKKSYNRTMILFDRMHAKLSEAYNKAHLTSKMRSNDDKYLENIRTNYYKAFGEAARNQRLAKVNENLRNLDEDVFGEMYKHPITFIKTKLKSGIFLAEEKAEKAKIDNIEEIDDLKELITFSVYDNLHKMKRLVKTLDRIVNYSDHNSQKYLEKIKVHLKSYEKALEVGGSKHNLPNKNIVAEDLNNLANELSNSNLYNDELKQKAVRQINKLAEANKFEKMGDVQKMMKVLKPNISEKEYKELKKYVNRALGSLNHSVDLETDKLFDKIRDFKLGSAPHDVLAFIASLGVMGVGVAKADDEDQRISVALKYGIPAVGAVGIAILCTVGLVASGPSLLIGAASGLVINKIGEAVDDIRKKNDNDTSNDPPVKVPSKKTIKTTDASS